MENNNYTYDAAANLMLAFRTLCDLERVAHEDKLRAISMITEEHNGRLTFFLESVKTTVPCDHEVTDIMTEEASIFAQKIAAFKAYWEQIMAKEKATNAGRIAALKEELAKLEGK